jgi:hypothetical protein
MSDLIYKANGEPFPTKAAAASQQPMWVKRGTPTEVVELDNNEGFVLQPISEEEVSMKEPEVQEPKKAKRPKRIPLGSRNVLTAAHTEGYVERFVNDTEQRIRMFEDAGWEVVTGPEKAGDEYAGNTRLPGGAVTKPVGHGIVAVLMRKRKDWYDEDMAVKQARVDETEKGLTRKAQLDNLHAPRGEQGGIKISRPS